MKVTIAIPCKGRLRYLQHCALPSAVAQDYDDKEIIVVDYQCPDGTNDYVRQNYPKVKVIKADVPTGHWLLPHARNLALLAATGEFVLALDAENILPTSFVSATVASCNIYQGYVLPAGEKVIGTNMVFKENALKVRGYNEKMIGYGHDDREFYARLEQLLGLKRLRSPLGIEIIPHSDDLRVQFSPLSYFDAMANNERETGFDSILPPYPGMPLITRKGDFLQDKAFRRWYFEKHGRFPS